MNKFVTVKTVEAVRELHFKQQGITLVALVVTIIVLLILAGVTITSLLGDDGIIAKAQRAADETNTAVQREQEGMNALLEQLNNYGNGTGSGGEDTTSIPEELEKYILGEDKTGILATDIFDMATMKFKDNDIIPDASTSVIFLNAVNLTNEIHLIFEYDNQVYVGIGDSTTYKTKELRKAERIYEGSVELTVNNIADSDIAQDMITWIQSGEPSNFGVELENLTGTLTPAKKYILNLTVNGEKQTSIISSGASFGTIIMNGLLNQSIGLMIKENKIAAISENNSSDTLILNSINEIGANENYAEENGFVAIRQRRLLVFMPNASY